jgi:large subunit ribosomal protein L22
MPAIARTKYLRMTPRKVRMVGNQIRGKGVQTAIDYLNFCRRRAARPLVKLVKSAVANAAQKGGMDIDNLYIKDLQINAGPTMKRWMPRARGMATQILKRTSHITVVLDEK